MSTPEPIPPGGHQPPLTEMIWEVNAWPPTPRPMQRSSIREGEYSYQPTYAHGIPGPVAFVQLGHNGARTRAAARTLYLERLDRERERLINRLSALQHHIKEVYAEAEVERLAHTQYAHPQHKEESHDQPDGPAAE